MKTKIKIDELYCYLLYVSLFKLCFLPETIQLSIKALCLILSFVFFIQKVKKKIYARLAQIKGRGAIDPDKLNLIYAMYENFFCNEYRKHIIGDTISEVDYETFVSPILYQIKLNMSGELPAYEVSRNIVIAFYKSGYEKKDVSKLCGIASQNLNYYINGKYEYGSLHTDTALKLCYLLKLDFKTLFVSCEKNN